MNDLLFNCSEERGEGTRNMQREKNAPGSEVFPHWLCPLSLTYLFGQLHTLSLSRWLSDTHMHLHINPMLKQSYAQTGDITKP